jgi:hypothetical protein
VVFAPLWRVSYYSNHVPKEYIVTAILSLLFMAPESLVPALALMYFYIALSEVAMCAVPNMAIFCSSLTSLFPSVVLTYFLNDFEMVPVAPSIIIIIITTIIIIINSNAVSGSM